MKTTLVILAAGIGSRFGKGIKQLTGVGPNGELIIDYSIHDALEAGFNKVVFIIRHALEEDFKRIIGDRISGICEVAYAYQELTDLPEGFAVPEGRTKPWGTGHALLSCRGIVCEPFAVINADDYYGKEAFRKMHDFLLTETRACMAGFVLKNTLSENGGVTRGICTLNDRAELQNIVETREIQQLADGSVIGKANGETVSLSLEDVVSMNMWGLQPSFIDYLAEDFPGFLQTVPEGDFKTEYLLPTIIGGMLKKGEICVQMLKTDDRWFGVTYQADTPSVVQAFQALHQKGVYPAHLLNA